MLFIESRLLDYAVAEATRLKLLAELPAEAFAPLIGPMRRRCFELLAAASAERGRVGLADELESESANWQLTMGRGAYTPGELFCGGDHILFLIFSDPGQQVVQAGIIFNIETIEPLRRLDLFCQLVRDSLLKLSEEHTSPTSPRPDVPAWVAKRNSAPQSLARFIAMQDDEF